MSNMSSQPAQSRKQQPEPVPLTRRYLILYNAGSLLCWSSLLGRVLLIIPLAGLSHVYPSAGNFARSVQTLAILEVFHSLAGLVRAPVMTTAMQVASRLLLVWGVVGLFGDELLKGRSIGGFRIAKSAIGIKGEGVGWNQAAYFGMLVAWSVTECIRYAYFVFFLGAGATGLGVPKWLLWLRYNTFFILYPLGITCECWLVYRAIPFAMQWDPRYAYSLIAVLFIYIPGSYILYSHMMAQRRRTLRGKQKVRS